MNSNKLDFIIGNSSTELSIFKRYRLMLISSGMFWVCNFGMILVFCMPIDNLYNLKQGVFSGLVSGTIVGITSFILGSLKREYEKTKWTSFEYGVQVVLYALAEIHEIDLDKLHSKITEGYMKYGRK